MENNYTRSLSFATEDKRKSISLDFTVVRINDFANYYRQIDVVLSGNTVDTTQIWVDVLCYDENDNYIYMFSIIDVLKKCGSFKYSRSFTVPLNTHHFKFRGRL